MTRRYPSWHFLPRDGPGHEGGAIMAFEDWVVFNGWELELPGRYRFPA